MAERLKQFLLNAARLVALWIVDDVIYAVLPILVVAAVTVILTESFNGFWQLKDWSFANIVLFGVGLRKFVNLHADNANGLSQWQREAGIQLFGLALIASVMVLVFVILNEKHALSGVAVQYLGTAQITLFVAGLLSLLVCVIAKDLAPKAQA